MRMVGVVLGVVLLGWAGVVVWADSQDGPIPHPAPVEAVARGPLPEAVRFARVIVRGQSAPSLALVTAGREGQDRFTLLTGAEGPVLDGPFGSVAELLPNMAQAKAVIGAHTAVLAALPALTLRQVELLPFLDPPTKVLHGAQSALHYRNSKRVVVRGMMPWVNTLLLSPYNALTADSFYGVDPSSMPFDFFHGNNVGLYSTGQDIPLFHGTTHLDVEAELAVVIGKPGRNLRPDQVADHIAGFVLFNDFTDREDQARERSTTYTGYNTSKYLSGIGPYLVSDLDPAEVTVTVNVNGQPRLTTHNDEIIAFMPLAEQVAEYSKYFLAPGQIIALGTMPGGSLAELELPLLAPGDEVELIGNQGLGTLKNRVVLGSP